MKAMTSGVKHRIPRLLKITLIVAASLCLCFFLFFHLALKGFDEWHAQDYGHIRLPNNYEIAKLSAERRVLCHDGVDSAGSEVSDGVVVDWDIDAVAWNQRYVFLHVSDREGATGSGHYQILDTQTGGIDAYRTLDDAKPALRKLNAENLELKYTFDLFPETKTSSPHVFDHDSYTFVACVLTKQSSSLMVYKKDIHAADRLCHVNIKDASLRDTNGKPISADSIQPGQMIQVTGGGAVWDIYPPIYHTVYDVNVLKEKDAALYEEGMKGLAKFITPVRS